MQKILIKGLFVPVILLSLTSSVSALTCTTLTKNLSKGSENSEVLKLQQFLFDGGYLTAKPNGYFGGGTVAAVNKFQIANSLSQAGTVGPVTRSKIKELSCKDSIVSSTMKYESKSNDVKIYATTTSNIKKEIKINGTKIVPTLSVSATPMSVDADKTTTVTWKSNNTTECFVEGKGQNSIRAKQRRNSNGEQEIGAGSSLLTISINCTGKNGQIVSKELLIRINSPHEPVPSSKQNEPGVKRYEMYMSGNLTMVSYLTRPEAMDNCVEVNHKNNPKSSIECMWGDEKIYMFFSEKTKQFWKDSGNALPDFMG